MARNGGPKGVRKQGGELSGPIGQALGECDYEQVILLADQKNEDVQAYSRWLVLNGAPKAKGRKGERSRAQPTSGKSTRSLKKGWKTSLLATAATAGDLTIHLSPGTPAMQAVWIILARTRTTARLTQSSREAGVQDADIPFDIAAEFIPDLVSAADLRRRRRERRETARGGQLRRHPI